jgi:hypothetical protein
MLLPSRIDDAGFEVCYVPHFLESRPRCFFLILTFSGAEEPRIVFHGVSHESPEHCSGVGGYCFDR